MRARTAIGGIGRSPDREEWNIALEWLESLNAYF